MGGCRRWYKGHHVQQLVGKSPTAQGKFAVQDLPFVIEDIQKSGVTLSPRIGCMAHSFLEPQPIKGARIYWLAHILHNLPDAVCQIVPANLREAMTPGYSKLIIANTVIADENVPLRQSGLDITMLLLHNGSQRSEAEWRQLLEEAGFTVNNIWHPPGDGDGIIVAEVPQLQ